MQAYRIFTFSKVINFFGNTSRVVNWEHVWPYTLVVGPLMGGNVLMDNHHLLIMDGHARHVIVNDVAKARVM